MQQLGQLRGEYDKFTSLNAEVLTIAVDDFSRPDLASRAKQYPFPMLYDVSGDVARSYEVYSQAGYANPAVFIVDTNGSLVWEQLGSAYHRTPNDAILDELEKLS